MITFICSQSIGNVNICAKERCMKIKDAYQTYKDFKVPSLSEIRATASEHSKTSLVIIILLVVLLLLALQYIPQYYVAHFEITNPKDLADAENSYRTTLAKILGGGAVAIGIYFAWGNLTTAREGQITERFSRAIDQLGSDKLQIRLGGIYALERIANESEKDYWPIMKILAAYIRDKSSIKTEDAETGDTDERNEYKNIFTDNQVILDVISKREHPHKESLDLQRTYLRKANFREAHLEGANLELSYLGEANFKKAYLKEAYLKVAYLGKSNFERADLTKTHLERAYLKEARFVKANLEGAYLENAYLERANFREAYLEGVYLIDANLNNAHLVEANLERAYLIGANLKGADLGEVNFKEADLQGANLEGTRFVHSNLEEASLEWANLKGTRLIGSNLQKSNLHGADLQGADLMLAKLDEAKLEGANLKGAKNLTVDQLSKVKTLYNAKLDPELEEELRSKGCSHLLDDEP